MKHLLLVGTNNQAERSLTHILHGAEFTIDTATNHAGAEDRAANRAPDLVVLDLRSTPQESYPELRAIPTLSDAPVLALSPNTEQAVLEPLDADLMLAEPFTDEALLSAVDALHQAAPTIRALRERLRQAEAERDEMVSSDRKKDEFFSLMSHELKNPMASIKGYADLLRRRIAKNPGDPNEKGLDVISQQVSRMTSLLDQLLDFSRINMDRLQLDRRPCNLVRVVQLAALNMQSITTKHNVIEQIDVDHIPAFLDDTRITQALNNILSNAINYSPAGRNITVSVAMQESEPVPTALVSIADQGIGITEEDQQHLFERFFRARNAKELHNGMGLGLFVSREIIQRHGGTMWIESEPGNGTTVHFTLPLDSE